ncbi:hypothetical protein [Anaeropeptidivorans aminofermentans]|uniref:hypothetical protein n=1 Tax=Anaeropeptidivorans aminofermentans TaxID=2934315 RepID=UPI0020242B55|nr:hypothetical protein [Anaeropeptidivorans aminofermentans]
MGKMITIKQAACEFGLSEYELRMGIKNGKYPYIRVGEKNGKYLLSREQMTERIYKMSINNMKSAEAFD